MLLSKFSFAYKEWLLVKQLTFRGVISPYVKFDTQGSHCVYRGQ